jgi:hypothetical protein
MLAMSFKLGSFDNPSCLRGVDFCFICCLRRIFAYFIVNGAELRGLITPVSCSVGGTKGSDFRGLKTDMYRKFDV